MSDPLRDEHVHRDIEERKVIEPIPERRYVEPESSGLVAYAAIKYTAIVIIVLAILYFLAVVLIPALR